MTSARCAFGDLYAVPSRNGVSVPKGTRDSGTLMINMGELFRFDRVGDAEMARVPLEDEELAKSLVEPKDLLFARRSLQLSGAGRCAIVAAAREPRTFESSIIRVRLSPERAVPEFYFYFFKSPAGRRLMDTIVEQAVVAGIRASDLRLLRVPHPPLEEQRGIAATLGALDDKIESNRGAIRLAQELLGALYRQPEDRSRVPASALLRPVLGGTPSRSVAEYWGGPTPWAAAKDVAVADTWFVLQTADGVTESGVANSATKVLPAGSIVMTARGTVGALARVAEPMAFNQTCYGLMPSEGVPEGLLFLGLREAVQRIRGAGHGTVFNTVNMATFDQIDIDWPRPTAELVARIDTLFALILQRARENDQLAALRDALLPELLSGRIRVPEAAEAVVDATA